MTNFLKKYKTTGNNTAKNSNVRDFLKELFNVQFNSEFFHIPKDVNQRRYFGNGIFTRFKSKDKNFVIKRAEFFHSVQVEKRQKKKKKIGKKRKANN